MKRIFVNKIAYSIMYTIVALACWVETASAEKLKNVIPRNQKPVLKTFPPAASDKADAGDGKFVIFTREHIGKDWDFIAGAWECFPSRPDVPITKRVEFCHSSWACNPLLDGSSALKHPRFVRLQVDSDDQHYSVNLYDIDYRTWDVRCIWQGSRLSAYGVIGDSIFCESSEGSILIDVHSGSLRRENPFTLLATHGDFWLVRKPGEVEGAWSYDCKKGQFIAKFGHVEKSKDTISRSILSSDGKSLAWVGASGFVSFDGGALKGRLLLQRDGKEDVSVPIEMWAVAGSGIPVIPVGIQLSFTPAGKVQFRASMGDPMEDETMKDRIWSIDIATGEVTADEIPHEEPIKMQNTLGGIPVPEYLQKGIDAFASFGQSGIAPAFFVHLGILEEKPRYGDGIGGVSPDGRHVLYCPEKGPLAGFLLYGDLLTKKTVRWKSPDGLHPCKFVWVETSDAEQVLASCSGASAGREGAATSTKYMGRELTKLSPIHARLLAGRELFIDAEGVAYVKINPAPVVRLTDELLSLTFAFPKSEKEALEIAGFPHTGAIVQSEKVLDEIVSMMEKAGLAKVPHGQSGDIESFTFRKDYDGYEYGETVTKRANGGFSVEFVAFVRDPLAMGETPRVSRSSYNFEKDDIYHPDGHTSCYSQYDLMVGPALNWQTMEGAPPERVSSHARAELVRKMLAMCGIALPLR